MLNDLFARLRLATTPAEIQALQEGIWQIWLNTGEVATDKILEEGMRASQAGDYGRAIELFTQIILLAPHCAEGWNKRATAHYLRGEFRASLTDITETLRREPRHFGALNGQLSMLWQLNAHQHALGSARKLSVLCPHLPGLAAQILALQELLDNNKRLE